jgi:hypothetical protein
MLPHIRHHEQINFSLVTTLLRYYLYMSSLRKRRLL